MRAVFRCYPSSPEGVERLMRPITALRMVLGDGAMAVMMVSTVVPYRTLSSDKEVFYMVLSFPFASCSRRHKTPQCLCDDCASQCSRMKLPSRC